MEGVFVPWWAKTRQLVSMMERLGSKMAALAVETEDLMEVQILLWFDCDCASLHVLNVRIYHLECISERVQEYWEPVLSLSASDL